MPRIQATGALEDTGLRDGIEACAALIARRRWIGKRVAQIAAYALIPATWFLPFAEVVHVSVDEHVYSMMIWAWGWMTSDAGWFGIDGYTNQVERAAIMFIAAVHAIIITLAMAWQGIDAGKGRRPTMVPGLILISVATLLVGNMIIGGGFWLAGAQFASAIALWITRASWTPTDVEQLQFQTAAQAIGQTIGEMQGKGDMIKSDVDVIRRDLDWLKGMARDAGVNISKDLQAGYQALPGLDARCSLNEAIWIDGTVSVDQLLAISGLDKVQFDTMLLDMCRQLDLSTDGKVVSARSDRSTSEILKEIDGFFAQWREAAADKIKL